MPKQIKNEPRDLGWLMPLALDYLKALGELDFVQGEPTNTDIARAVQANDT